MRKFLLAGLLPFLLAISHSAIAENAAKSLTYTYLMFEMSVPHSDLEDCPKAVTVEKAFCRLVMQNDAFHVYAFSFDGDQPLVAFQTFEEGEFEVVLK